MSFLIAWALDNLVGNPHPCRRGFERILPRHGALVNALSKFSGENSEHARFHTPISIRPQTDRYPGYSIPKMVRQCPFKGVYPDVWLDARYEQVREDHRGSSGDRRSMANLALAQGTGWE